MQKEANQNTYSERAYGIKKHDATRLHYDVRLECNGVLRSWVLLQEPGNRVGVAYTAIEVEDHDPANLHFEGLHRTGPIMLWDRGTWNPSLGCDDAHGSLEHGFVTFTLRGEKLHGIWTLTREGFGKNGRPVWTLRKEADLSDGASIDARLLQNWPKSISTGRTLEEIVRDWYTPKAKQKGPSLFD